MWQVAFRLIIENTHFENYFVKLLTNKIILFYFKIEALEFFFFFTLNFQIFTLNIKYHQ